jgi:hypothetical protein
VFDLPQHLNANRPSEPESSDQQPRWTAVTSHPAGEVSANNTHTQSPEDWTFLRDFGDPTDEFYELDVQLRGLLDGGFDPAAFNFRG